MAVVVSSEEYASLGESMRVDPPVERHRRRIGMIAGWGQYPRVVVEALKKQHYEVHCLAVKDHCDPALAELCDDVQWIGLAKLGRAIRYFRSHDVRKATMAGKIHKVSLFQPRVWIRHLPDWRALRRLAPYILGFRGDLKDDTLITAVLDEFSRDGIVFRPATDFVPELLVRYGQLTRRAPSRGQRNDIEFGWTLAKELGRVDVGQSVCVKDRAPLAVEAIEGTDECIRRAGRLCAVGGFTVVKVAKPQQDMRFDVPTIGLGTLEAMVEAGAKVLALEAGRTIVLEEDKVLDFADRHGLVIVSLDRGRQIETPSVTAVGASR